MIIVDNPFTESAKYFQSPIQLFTFVDKYSRWDYKQNRRESWIETVQRAVDYLRELSQDRLPSSDYERIYDFILNMKAAPSMRLLAMAGDAARRQNLAIYNCLSRDTKFVTSEGLRSFSSYSDGDIVMVPTHTGAWKRAVVKFYGVGKLRKIIFKRGISQAFDVWASDNHRWILEDSTECVGLVDGAHAAAAEDTFSAFNYDEAAPQERLYWAYGYVYGDGTRVKDGNGQYKYSMVRLCGSDKEKFVSRFEELGFKTSSNQSLHGDAYAYTGTYLKTPPNPSIDGPQLIKAFVRGYLDADGHKGTGSSLNLFDGIQSSEVDHIEFIRACFPVAGVYINSERDLTGQETNYGIRPYTISFRLSHVFSDKVNNQFVAHPTDEVVDGELWCLEVDDDHSFILEHGMITGNCSALPIDSIESYVEALLISMAGCGVGFSVEHQFVDKLPKVATQQTGGPGHFVVQDTTEGWADAVRRGLTTWFAGADITFDYSLVRPSGATLKVKGGQASGPEPLRRLLDFARSTILAAQGRKLTPLECHDIMCEVGSCAVSGGVRRTAMISLFDWDDEEMLHCKDGEFWREHDRRWNANNSVVWPKGITDDQIRAQMHTMVENGRGEPGIFSREAAVACLPDRRFRHPSFLTNPCGEIVLRPRQLCNLSMAIARHDDTLTSLKDKVEVATIIGTIQSMATNFPGLSDAWRSNCEEERLLGVDITGQWDCPILNDEVFGWLRRHAVTVNKRYAERLGINQSAGVTCVKPSGNSSQLFDCASGLHARFSPHYIRNVRVSAHSPVYKVLAAHNVPLSPENGSDPLDVRTWVASFPCKSPNGAPTSVTAVDQCEWWLTNKLHWTEHNPSVTITYEPHEVNDLIEWVVKHKWVLGGMAFLPRFDAKYDQLPYIEIMRDDYERRVRDFPEIDWSMITQFEKNDTTTASQEIACSSGVCSLDDVIVPS